MHDTNTNTHSFRKEVSILLNTFLYPFPILLSIELIKLHKTCLSVMYYNTLTHRSYGQSIQALHVCHLFSHTVCLLFFFKDKTSPIMGCWLGLRPRMYVMVVMLNCSCDPSNS